jgi:hypothetical protein
VPASFNHEAWLCADQVQSRAALTVTPTPPPSAGTTLDEVLIDAVQRVVPGAVTLVTDVEPQALT